MISAVYKTSECRYLLSAAKEVYHTQFHLEFIKRKFLQILMLQCFEKNVH